ncbi:2-oxo-4-hydroxy-4-carboxy-5-ureidoimidazoline decarboxylase [Aliiglaciecola sp.]|nr:2-oxo-4-hydroxy-4-carboxy-5-ureidoimidazoline decarboxylase [Aliiglaciecola sp.]
MTLTELNQLSKSQAAAWFSECCAAPVWCQKMASNRPYGTVDSILVYATTVWANLPNEEYLLAFEAHPMIGDIASLKKKYASTSDTAQQEQSGAQSAEPQVLQELAQLNHEYLAKHGFIFIICATGLSAQKMLDALKSRIVNSTTAEIKNAAQEQIKITLLRITKNITSSRQPTGIPHG